MDSQRLRCPICGSDTDSNLHYWGSEFSLASHIVSLAKNNDPEHLAWLGENTRTTDFSEWKATGRASGNFSAPDKSLIRELVPVLLECHHTMETTQQQNQNVNVLALQHIENALHSHIRARLVGEFGDAWWIEGVPLEVRKACAGRREEDASTDDPYGYTTLIELSKIVEKYWRLFEEDFKKCRPYVAAKRDFLSVLDRLNRLRNRYVHSVRAPMPGGPEAERDQIDIQGIAALMRTFCGNTA